MMVKTRKAPLVGVFGIVVALLAACGSDATPAPTPSASTAEKGLAPSPPPTPTVPPAWPLTGVASDDVAVRPALAVKIENSARSRPQYGLDQADIVWEEVVEGGITRFVAVFHSRVPEKVGPVRSIRPMDPAIVAPMHGILVYSGGQQPFIDALDSTGVQSMREGSPGFFRDSGRRAPHNLMGTPSTFWEQADEGRTAPPPAQFVYGAPGEATATTTGTGTTRIDVTMSPSSKPSWEWNAEAGAFERSEGTVPATAAGGERVRAQNVVLLTVEVVDTAFRDPAGTPVPETMIVGSGRGTVASGGKSIPVSWSKAAVDAPVVLTSDAGDVTLEPGTTWVELVPGETGGVALG